MAPVPTMRVRVLRGFYVEGRLLPTGSIQDVPANIVRQLVTDGKAEVVKDEPKVAVPPAPAAAKKAEEKEAARPKEK